MHTHACALPCLARLCKREAKLAVNFRVLAPSLCEEGQIKDRVSSAVSCTSSLHWLKAIDISGGDRQSWLAAPSRPGRRQWGRPWGLMTGKRRLGRLALPWQGPGRQKMTEHV